MVQIWHELVKDGFQTTALRELKSAPYVFKDNEIIVMCNVNDYLMFAKHQWEKSQSQAEFRKRLHPVRIETAHAPYLYGGRLDKQKDSFVKTRKFNLDDVERA